MSDFSWSEDDSVCIPSQPAIAVYTNPAGEIVIRQDGWPDEDVFVFVNRGNAEALIRALADEAGVPVSISGSGRKARNVAGHSRPQYDDAEIALPLLPLAA